MLRSITTGLALQLLHRGSFPSTAQHFAGVDPTEGIGELELAPLNSRALKDGQIPSQKNLCDHLDHIQLLKGHFQNCHLVQAYTVSP